MKPFLSTILKAGHLFLIALNGIFLSRFFVCVQRLLAKRVFAVLSFRTLNYVRILQPEWNQRNGRKTAYKPPQPIVKRKTTTEVML